MTSGRIVGLDYGERRIGVAVSDALRLTAQPWGVIDRKRDDVVASLRRLVGETEATLIVVGLPIHLAGHEGPAAEAARRFAADVADITGLPVEFTDERFTTAVAERVLLESGMRREQRREARDKVAAAVMLQSYLDGLDRTGSG